MQYLRNVDITKQYPVSEATVRKWIKAVKEGKLELVLVNVDGRQYIADSSANHATIRQLVEENRKYRNAKAAKEVAPQAAFYELFTQERIYDIMTNLELHQEIPRKYNYIDRGAANWDKYANQLLAEEIPNTLTSTIRLLEENQQYLNFLLRNYERINIVDIGVGNALPVKGLLTRFLEQGKLGRYLALDISAEMLEIAHRNIKEWFDNKILFEGYVMDIDFDRFAPILAEEYLRKDSERTANLVLVLGGMLNNLREPAGAFRVIRNSMGPRDLLLHSQKLDTETARRYFYFNIQPGITTLSPNHRFIFDLLNINESFYKVEMGYDDKLKQRYIRVRLKVALTLGFNFAFGERTLEFNKGDTILLWRAWHQSALGVCKQFDHNGFYIMHASQTDDSEYILTVSRVKTET